MDKYTGLLSKIRLLSEKPLLVRFTLETSENSISCLVSRRILARQVAMLPDGKYNITVLGKFTDGQQFVVRNLVVNNWDRLIKDLGIKYR